MYEGSRILVKILEKDHIKKEKKTKYVMTEKDVCISVCSSFLGAQQTPKAPIYCPAVLYLSGSAETLFVFVIVPNLFRFRVDVLQQW